MMTAGWAAFGLSFLIAVCGVVGSWAVVQHKVNKAEDQLRAFTEALSRLDSAIREVGREIKGLLFNASDAGRPFYRRVDDCTAVHRDCREDIEERLVLLENKAHTHGERVQG